MERGKYMPQSDACYIKQSEREHHTQTNHVRDKSCFGEILYLHTIFKTITQSFVVIYVCIYAQGPRSDLNTCTQEI
jgi:hypothetical protein